MVRFLNKNGTVGYETIDFRETMPAAGNETVSILPMFRGGDAMIKLHLII